MSVLGTAKVTLAWGVSVGAIVYFVHGCQLKRDVNNYEEKLNIEQKVLENVRYMRQFYK